MDFPITDLMDEQACYRQLLEWLHPDGFACPRYHADDRMVVHRRGRDPVLDFRCGHCKRVFNAFTGTALHGRKRRPRELVLIIRGFAHATQGNLLEPGDKAEARAALERYLAFNPGSSWVRAALAAVR